MVLLEHIYKSYGTQPVLRDVCLEIPKGQIVGLLGPNGAGKSTLMKILVGLVEPEEPAAPVGPLHCKTANAVGPQAQPAERYLIQKPGRIGYLPENNPLYEEMYVSEYLRFMYSLETGLRPDRVQTANADRVQTLIDLVGLTAERHKHIKELSKGYRQRVGLAQALLGEPDLLILDEPTTGLDPNQLVEIRSLIRELGKDRTVILSTHILQEVREMCDRVVILDHGEIKADRTIDEVEDLETLFRSVTC